MKKLTIVEMQQGIAGRTAMKLNKELEKINAKEYPSVKNSINLLEWLVGALTLCGKVLEDPNFYPTSNTAFEAEVRMTTTILYMYYKLHNNLKENVRINTDKRRALLLCAVEARCKGDLDAFFDELCKCTDMQKVYDYTVLFSKEVK